MSRQVQDAYIVAAARTPIGKAPRGAFRNTRPDDLLVAAIKGALAQAPGLDPKVIEDAIIAPAVISWLMTSQAPIASSPT